MGRRRLWWASFLIVSGRPAVVGMMRTPVPLVVLCASLLGTLLGLHVSHVRFPPRVWWDATVGPVVLAAALSASRTPGRVLILLVCLLAPPVSRRASPAVSRLVRQTRSRTWWVRHRRDVEGAEIDSFLSLMTGEQLCEEWARSFVALKSARSVGERAVVAGLRTALLDELERRDPDAFVRWLAHGPVPTRQPRWALKTVPSSTRRSQAGP